MMGKLSVIFVALFVASIAATPSNLLTNLKSLQQVKRAATLLEPLHSMNEEKKGAENIQPLMMMLDADHDGMLNAAELKTLLSMSGAPPSQSDMLLNMLMGFDKDNNKKLDMNEMVAAGAVLGF